MTAWLSVCPSVRSPPPPPVSLFPPLLIGLGWVATVMEAPGQPNSPALALSKQFHLSGASDARPDASFSSRRGSHALKYDATVRTFGTCPGQDTVPILRGHIAHDNVQAGCIGSHQRPVAEGIWNDVVEERSSPWKKCGCASNCPCITRGRKSGGTEAGSKKTRCHKRVDKDYKADAQGAQPQPKLEWKVSIQCHWCVKPASSK